MEAFRERDHGVEFAQATEVATSDTPLLMKAADKRDEIQACALWVKRQLADADRPPRIAVVVPAVSTVRPEIERVFHQILAPDAVTIRDRDLPLPFEFSLGAPLAGIPMARAALLLLRWMNEPLLQDHLSWLMLSGFICEHEEELLQIASFDARLRQLPMRQPEQDLETFLDLLSEGWREAIPLSALRDRLRTGRRLLPAREGLSFAEWVAIADRILETVHWPGPHLLQSEDFQVQARWSRLLDSVAALAFDGRAVSYAEFLEVLERQAGQTIFAPESRDAPVQILGPLEAAGLTFDALWFLGADDGNWPAAARPHAFSYPIAAAQTWHAARRQRGRLEAGAAGDPAAGEERGPMRLQLSRAKCRRRMPAIDAGELCQRRSVRCHRSPRAQPRDSLLCCPMTRRPRLFPGPWSRMQGALKYSGARRPVHFNPLPSSAWPPGPWMKPTGDWKPRERGIVVHKILEALWEELKSGDGLRLAVADGRLTEMIAQRVNTAATEIRPAYARAESAGARPIWMRNRSASSR